MFPGIIKSQDFSNLPDYKILDDMLVSCVQSSAQKQLDCEHLPIVEGKLLVGLTAKEMEVLDWFEEVDIMYKRSVVRVAAKEGYQDQTPDISWIDANVYIWLLNDKQKTPCVLSTSSKWCYTTFREKYLDKYLDETVAKCRKELDRLNFFNPK